MAGTSSWRSRPIWFGSTLLSTTPSSCSPSRSFACSSASTLRASSQAWAINTGAARPRASWGRLKPNNRPSLREPAASSRVRPSATPINSASAAIAWGAATCSPVKSCCWAVGAAIACSDGSKAVSGNEKNSPTKRTSSSIRVSLCSCCSRLVAKGLP